MVVEWKINKEHQGMIIRDFLQKIHSFSRRMIIDIKNNGGKILVNGCPETVRFPLKVNDQLTIKLPPEEKGFYMNPENIPLHIIYEDDDVLVIHKKPNMATTPSPHQPYGTVANGVLAYYEEKGIPYTVHVVTRLDRDTSGLLLIAKHRYSHSLLAKSQQGGQITREYKAIIEGHLKQKQGTIMKKIGRKEGSIIERTVSDYGKEAITHYQMISETKTHSLIHVQLETGRTHQIRVHFSHIGHPLAGDDLYGGSKQATSRQALHCDYIRFKHPISKKVMSFHTPLPEDMETLMDSYI